MGACFAKGASSDRASPGGTAGPQKAKNADEVYKSPSNKGTLEGQGQAYKVIKLLGRGAEANTWLVEEIHTKRRWAMKLIKLPLPSKLVPSITREIKLQSALGEGHDNIITPEEVVLTSHYLGLIMELAPGGSLTTLITNRFNDCGGVGLLMPEDEARYFFKQMVDAVAWCHKRNVVHRDLKLDNTLLSGHSPPYIKICDFGFARDWSEGLEGTSTVIGTPDYMAPELTGAKMAHKEVHDGTKADVWALGVILCVILIGKFPFEGDSVSVMAATDAVHKVWVQQRKGKWDRNKLLHSQLEYLSPDCKDLLDRMFETDIKKRISIAGVRDHPWMKIQMRPHFEEALERLSVMQDEVERKVAAGQYRSKERDQAITSLIKVASSDEFRKLAAQPITTATTFKIYHRITLRTCQESYPVFTRHSLRQMVAEEKADAEQAERASANGAAHANPLAAHA